MNSEQQRTLYVILRSIATKNLLPFEILRLRLRMTAAFFPPGIETRTV
jgi:hypothetical protein